MTTFVQIMASGLFRSQAIVRINAGLLSIGLWENASKNVVCQNGGHFRSWADDLRLSMPAGGLVTVFARPRAGTNTLFQIPPPVENRPIANGLP